jgi:hypothetical protein
MKLLNLFIFLFLLPQLAWPQSKKANLSPDSISAKALIEDILVRRYSQDLSTQINSDLFSMSAQLDIKKVKSNSDAEKNEPLNDLMLGILDPEKLSSQTIGGGNEELLNTFLSQYSIAKVNMSVGLNSGVDEEKRKQVKDWLDKRLKSEFGGKSVGLVNIIGEKPFPKKPPKTMLDHLQDFQDLAGQLALALALIVGALFIGLFARSATKVAVGGDSSTIQQTVNQKAKAMEEEERRLKLERTQKEEEKLTLEINGIVEKINSILPQVGGQFDSLVTKWCQAGEKGLFRLVCFAEAVSKDLGKLSIPVDASEKVKNVFAQMPNVKLHEKKEALEKAYWDLMTLMNLGNDALAEPFAYLSASNVDTVNSVLMEKNAKMKTLVALYMPDNLRKEFIEGLEPDRKKELLISASQMQSLPASEFKSIDDQMRFQLNQQGEGPSDEIQLDMPLNKILQGFKLSEQIHFMKEMPQEQMTHFKKTTPHLAFIDEWPEEELKGLMAKLNSDEIVNYLRLVPEAENTFLNACPPLTVKIVKDELKRDSELSDNDITRLLNNMNVKMINLYEQGEVNLQKIFTAQKNDSTTAA